MELINEVGSGSVFEPEPSQLRLIIVTCKTYLNCNINLDLLARCLPLDHEIIGKKLIGVITEGRIKSPHPKTVRDIIDTLEKRFLEPIHGCYQNT